MFRRTSALLLPLLLAALLPRCHPFAPPFTSSEYYSADKVAHLPCGDDVLDAARPEQLLLLAQRRSYKGQIIVFLVGGSNYWAQYGLNAMLQLEEVG